MKTRCFACAISILLALNAVAHEAGNDMAMAARAFLGSLSSDQKAKAAFPLKGDERENWHFIPKDRKGLPLKEMNSEQRALALALLKSGLSDHGYGKATNIMSLEMVLQDMEGANRRFPRDPRLYYVSVFGAPEAKGTWGWRVEGHHCSANFTIVAGEVASTPSFLGSNPGEVRSGGRKGLRVLAEEEDIARQLVKALDAGQRKEAIYTNTAPKDILTEAQPKVKPLETTGIARSKLKGDQSELLMKLIETYVQRVRPDLAKEDLDKIHKAGTDKIYFAWAGGTERGDPHYYRVQGPTFLMEYDNTQNDANHIHAVWRDFQNDFGEDLLARHLRENPH